MENRKLFHILLISFSLTLATPFAYGWGFEGHTAICRIAQARLTKPALAAFQKLLPINGDFGALCPWADTVKFRYRWSSSLHFINTPESLCSYSYARDCKDRVGVNENCLEGAINNYTTQLNLKKMPQYNLTEALLFLSHFIGDIHQPLHTGFASDKGGNTINVRWFNRASELHHVWDTDIIKSAQGKGASATTLDGFINQIQQKINGLWAKQVNEWEACMTETCPNVYATESIKAACEWAYKGVQTGSVLGDEYFKTRLPIVEMRIAQAGVRLAATLNRILAR
ncbi:endonuclease 2-like [Salvia hispanica]|uniref:endonuclease 2-like n=1 Tax=Salvia hispanica TaxID=49212 RepID=UPI002009234B|nr:endonuclease 2-like [Salvia hispanica]